MGVLVTAPPPALPVADPRGASACGECRVGPGRRRSDRRRRGTTSERTPSWVDAASAHAGRSATPRSAATRRWATTWSSVAKRTSGVNPAVAAQRSKCARHRSQPAIQRSPARSAISAGTARPVGTTARTGCRVDGSRSRSPVTGAMSRACRNTGAKLCRGVLSDSTRTELRGVLTPLREAAPHDQGVRAVLARPSCGC